MDQVPPQTSRARSRFDRALVALRGAGYLRKWLILGILIGVVAGLGAIVFTEALQLATRTLLAGLGGYTPPSPAGEGDLVGSAGFVRPWAIPLVVGLGGLVSGVLVFSLAPEAEGHGTDAAIEAVHHSPGGIRARVSVVKIIASAITIGAGGSAGREGPTAQISAGFGSLLARKLELTPADARIAVTVGMGAGIGAIFRAPLGGAVLGAEILYREDAESEALLPSFIASIIGFSVFGAFKGFSPIFGVVRGYHFQHPLELLSFALLGVGAGLMGKLYALAFYGTTDVFRRLPGSRMLKPAAAGVLVGLVGLVAPAALGTGYGWVQKAMTTEVLQIPLWLVVLLPFAKIAATSLSIGSGGSGGIFGPGMVIGGFLGAAVWRVLEPLSSAVPQNPAPFVIVGMIACFGSVSHAYLAVMLMVAEMTGGLALLPPAMISLGLAALVVGETTIYRSQLRSRAESTAHRMKLGLPLLATVAVTEAMAPPRLVLEAPTTVRESLDRLERDGLPGAPVTDSDGVFKGAVSIEHLRAAAGDGAERPVGEVLDPGWPAIPQSAAMDAAVDALATGDATWVTVIGLDDRIQGIVGMTELIEGYRRALSSSLRRLAGVTGETALVEETVAEGSPVARKTVAEVNWPPGTVVVTVQRRGHLLFPQGSTRLEAGDVVNALTRSEQGERLRALVHGIGDGEEPEERGPDMI